MHLSHLTIEGFRCFGTGERALRLKLRQGLTALVGENDGGKTAVVDALRLALGTTDQEWQRLSDEDFNLPSESAQIMIACEFSGLTDVDRRAFVEFLTYADVPDEEPILILNWSVDYKGQTRRGRTYRRPEVHSGRDGLGPVMPPEIRDLLRATYLRPLRNASHELSAGRGSRLSQVLQNASGISMARRLDDTFDPLAASVPEGIGILDIGSIANSLLEKHEGILEASARIDERLEELSIRGDKLKSDISVSEDSTSDELMLRHILEKLDLGLQSSGQPGLGSSNLLFMACELLLLSQDEAGARLLLIEEPEAHLHPQRQLRVMRFLQEQARDSGMQVIVTTHSPNLASVIDLSNLVVVKKPHAFSLAEGETQLERSDYNFLERFLDVTKANLFFAQGVIVVEGPSECILLPTLAKILRKDFSEFGVSVVNVGGVGLRRYARIFMRSSADDPWLDVPVACLTDMDVMPDFAPAILGKIVEGDALPATNKRRWRVTSDFADTQALAEEREKRASRASGQHVRTFVSDWWTLEYDLALAGLASDVYAAVALAKNDAAISERKKCRAIVDIEAREELARIANMLPEAEPYSHEELLAAHVYAVLAKGGVSKPLAAQYLEQRLRLKHEAGLLSSETLRKQLPAYLVQAIDYVACEAPGEMDGDEGTDG